VVARETAWREHYATGRVSSVAMAAMISPKWLAVGES
jgi:hypothetical protein